MPISTKTFRVFVSSTFSDLVAERDALRTRVYPRLAALCKAHSASFQAVDLRWGVSRQASESQRTMRICLGEIDRCREMTPRPNFILLLGDRYGWRPVPEQIPADEFDRICGFCRQQTDPAESLRLLEQWYHLDDNALPPLYELQPREAHFATHAEWLPIEAKLGEILRQAANALGFSRNRLRRYQASATEQEVAHRGLLDGSNEDDSVFFFFRKIEGFPSDEKARQFVDMDPIGGIDTDAQAFLNRLKADLRRNYPANTFDYNAQWKESGPSSGHLDALCHDVYQQLSTSILQQLSTEPESSALETELRAHASFAEQRSRVFIGRKDTLQRIDQYISSPAGFPLVIHGASGSGKTTVLARALQSPELQRLGNPIFRFIGAVAGSSNIRLLLTSLCSQLRRRIDDFEDPPAEYTDLVRDFGDQLRECAADEPVIIFIDALDQLYDQYDAHGLAWLPFDLPENVHVVVSCLPGVCLEALQARLPPEQLLELDPMPRNDAEALLDRWLDEAERCLQREQRQVVIGAFRKNRLPLYLRLLFEQARTWSSSFRPKKPAGDIPGIIRETFSTLSEASRHGPVLVERSLAYIAAGRAGLSHEELIEVLSKDPRVMRDFRRRSPDSPATDALPAIVWSRLFLDLAPYLTDRLSDSTPVLAFFHRQLREVVQLDYLSADQKINRHQALSQYFANQEMFVAADGKQSANLRKLVEWPFQLRGARDWRRLSQVLGDFEFLAAKVATLGSEAVIEDFDLIDDAADDAPADIDFETLRTLEACLRLSSGVLSRDADQLPAQLHGRLTDNKSQLLTALLEAATERTSSPWLRPLRESLISTGEALLTSYVFDRSVEALAISPDAGRLLIGCDDGSVRIVQIDKGIESRRLQLHTSAVIGIKAIPETQCYVSGSRSGDVIVWNEEGQIYSRRQAPVKRLDDLVVSANGKAIVTGGAGERDQKLYDSGIISIWELDDTTEKQQMRIEGGSVTCVALNPAGDVLLSGTTSRAIQKWKFGDQKPLENTRIYGGGVFKVVFLPDGKRALICSGDQSGGRYDLRLWDVVNWEEQHVFEGHRYMLNDVAVLPAGDRALSASHDQTVCFWDLGQKQLIAKLTGHQRPVQSVIVDPAGEVAYSASGANVYQWSLNRAAKSGSQQGHTDQVQTVTASADGQVGISAAADGSIVVWDLSRPRPVISRQIQNRKLRCLCLSKDGQALFYTDDGNTVKRAGVLDEYAENLLTLPSNQATGLLTSDDDKVLYVGCDDGNLLAWDIRQGCEIWKVTEAHYGKIFRLALTNHGQWLITGGEPALHARQIKDGKRVVEMRNASGAPDLAASHHGRLVASGTHYGRVHVWDDGNSEWQWELPHAEIGQNYSVTAVACSPDGRYILSGGTDEIVRAWDGRSGALIATFIAEDRSTCAHAFGQDRFMVGSRNGAVHFLRLEK